MIVRFDEKFKKRLDKLPEPIRKKVQKQISFLLTDFFHPSLNTKRMAGENRWEFRIDRHYRMTGEKIADDLVLRTLGPHDTGLGKK